MPPTATEKKKNQDSETKVSSYKEGDVVKILAPGKHAGEIVGVLEVDTEGDMVRSEFGWLTYDQVEAAPEARAQRMTVDGQDSNVVLNGTTGAIVDDVLVRPPLDDLVRSLAKANETLDVCALAKKKASDAHKDAQANQNAIVAQIIEHYGTEHTQMPLQAQEQPTEGDEE